MKHLLIFLLLLKFSFGAYAQTDSINTYKNKSNTDRNESPYTTKFAVDAPIIGAGLGLSVLGLSMIQNKDPLTEAEVLALNRNDVNGFDRFAAGNFSEKANDDSYPPFYAAFAMPVVTLLNKNVGKKTGQVMVLYLETMAITGALFTLAAGGIDKPRPLVYSPTDASMAKRMSKNSQRSFYAGHTAATAAASFFAAKVFADFNPDSKAKPFVWAAAAILPASVGYLRLKAGQHFLSDNLLGYGIGAATGILVPHFHKKKNMVEGLSVSPLMGEGYNGMAMTYRFK
ncbi:MAG: phosphatase PAP2 family protein [Sphingobacteriaceae bacterium]